MPINEQDLKKILEAALYAAESPLSIDNMLALFIEDGDRPTRDQIRQSLQQLQQDYADRGVALTEVSSGFRFQARQEYAAWISRLWEERPPRYSRALLETLALVAYRQPITRGEIEAVRGVAVSSTIIKTLQERNWIKVVGHKELPGKPALYATTRDFLDYFNLKSLEELPALSDLMEFESAGQIEDGSDEGGDAAAAEMAQTAEARPDTVDGESADNPENTSAPAHAEAQPDLAADTDEVSPAVPVLADSETVLAENDEAAQPMAAADQDREPAVTADELPGAADYVAQSDTDSDGGDDSELDNDHGNDHDSDSGGDDGDNDSDDGSIEVISYLLDEESRLHASDPGVELEQTGAANDDSAEGGTASAEDHRALTALRADAVHDRQD